MSNEIKSQLSALMDGELDKDSAQFLLRRLASDPSLAEDWSRWHLLRDCMNGRMQAAPQLDLVSSVRLAIDGEATPHRHWSGAVLRWGAGGAIAAAVALAALIAMPIGPANDPASGLAAQPEMTRSPAAVSAVASSGLTERDLRPSLAPVSQTVSRSAQSMRLPPAVQVDPRIDAWLLRHNAALLQPRDQSFVPYIPVVSPHRDGSVRLVVEQSGEATR